MRGVRGGVVVLQTAMSSEFEAAARVFAGSGTQGKMAGRPMVQGRFDNLDVTVLRGGWGKVMAAASCQLAVDVLHPDLIVDCGTTGALRDGLKVGDIFVADTVIDGAMQTKWAAELVAGEGFFDLFGALPDAWHRGASLTVEETVDSADKRRFWAEQGLGAVAWEPFGLIKTAQVNAVSAMSLRVVSDLADEQVVETFEKHREIFLHRLTEALGRLLSSWWAWWSSREGRATIFWSHPERVEEP